MKNKLLKYLGVFSLSVTFIFSGCSKDWPTDPPDVVRPEIVSNTPDDGSLMNLNDSPVMIEFSKPMDLNSINSVVKVTDPLGNLIKGTWTLSGNKANFKPNSSYSDLTRIDVLVPGGFDENDNWISPGVQDVNGNSLKYTYQFSFSTKGNFGHSPIYLGTGEPGNPSGSQIGIGLIKDLQFSVVGDLAADGAKCIGLNPAGTELYIACSAYNSVEIMNTTTNAFDNSVPMPAGYGQPWFVEFTPDGSEAWILCKENNNIVVINTQTKSVTDTIPLADYAQGGTLFEIAINHAGTRAYLSTRGALNLIILDAQNKTVITTIENVASSQSSAVVITPDDSKILVGDNWSTPHFQIIDAASNTITGNITLGESAGSGLLTTVVDNYLFIAGRYEGFIYKMDLNDFSIVAETNTNEEMLGIAVDPDGEVIYVTAPWVGDGSVLVLTASDLTLLGRINTGYWRQVITR